MKLIEGLKSIPNGQLYRYAVIMLSCTLLLSPFLFLPGLVDNPDLCGKVCIRRFYLFFPGSTPTDIVNKMHVAAYGVYILSFILITTFFFGRMWCGYVCPVGGFPELVSRTFSDKWKIEYRALPQVPIRYGYFSVYIALMPMLGISACTLCNFITIPRIFDAMSGNPKGLIFALSAVGLVNIALLFLLGFFATKGRAYCQFLCPVGAIDGLVNRLGAKLRFTRRIRVERSRCTGCNICARNCMTGAIKMVDRVAIVDQLSCMSCHECVDVCDWGAIDWRSAPLDKDPKRKKKGIDFHPQPQWQAIHVTPTSKEKENINKIKLHGLKIGLGSIFFAAIILIGYSKNSQAEERHPDPDGCFSCHSLDGLDYIDDNGVRRSASIDKQHYYSSLHGSVPCKDCHRKISNYPHKVENGEVNCGDSCHVEEPSEGVPYSHKTVVKEYKDSVHGNGWSKGLTGGNRLKEAKEASNPSCRLCHSNELYIGEEELPKFKESFDHLDSECGSCHQGEVWLGQFGGHILRRFIGSRWSKNDHNKMCNQCHADHQRMANVKLDNKKTGEKEKVGPRFILASDSYATTLHNRLLETNVMQGASCIDCHAPTGFRHGVLRDDEKKSSTHADNLAKTCAQSSCHGYAIHPMNKRFVKTDLHDIDMVPIINDILPKDQSRVESNWVKALIALLPIIIILGGGSLLWHLFGNKKKSVIFSIFGGNAFQKKILGRRPKHKTKKERVKMNSPKIHLARKITLVLLIFFNSSLASEPLYFKSIKQLHVSEKMLKKSLEQLKEYKEINMINDLSVPPFHKQTTLTTTKKKTFCTTCHLSLPHRENKRSRTFMNMHSRYITCETCHFRPKEITLSYQWFSYKHNNTEHSLVPRSNESIIDDSTQLKTLPERKHKKQFKKRLPLAPQPGARITPFFDNVPVLLFEDNHFSQKNQKEWKDGNKLKRAEIKARLHAPLKKEGPVCQACHGKHEPMLDLEVLGATPEQLKIIQNNMIVQFFDRFKKDNDYIRIDKLLR